MSQKILFFALPYFFWMATVFAGEAGDFVAKGNTFAGEKKYQEALAEYERALDAEPKNVEALLLTGLAHANLSQFDKAISQTQKAAELDPSYSSFYHLGMIYAIAGDSTKSLEAFDRALAVNPDSFMAEYQRGLVYANREEHEQAIESYTKVLKLNPRFENARIALAGSYLKQGDKESALNQVEELRKMKQETIAKVLEDQIKERTA